MFRVEGKHHLWKHFLTVVFASILLAPLGMSTNQAFGMGQAPSTCPNRYDSAITSMIIDNGTYTFDAVLNPDATFTAEVNDGYKVSMTLHTASVSTQGNLDRGTTWYSDNVNGFYNGHCVADVGPNEDKILNLELNGFGKGTVSNQHVDWYTFGGPHVTYNVDWYGQWNNSPAQPIDDTAETTKNTPVTIDVLANDVDPDGDQLTVYYVQFPENGNGTAVINSNNTITYTPNQDFVGSDLFSYYVSDGKQDGGWAKVSVNVLDSQINPPPPSTVTLSVNSADMSGTTFSGQWVELWQNGVIIQENFTPFSATVESGTQYEVFIYDDPNEARFFDHWEDGSTEQRRAITPSQDTTLTAFFQTEPVIANNPPNAGDDFAETTIIPITIDVLANDVDSDGDPLTVDSIVIPPQNGQATINSDNTITYTPNLGFVGMDTFEYMVSDGNGGTDTALVSIAVNEILGPIPIPISILPL